MPCVSEGQAAGSTASTFGFIRPARGRERRRAGVHGPAERLDHNLAVGLLVVRGAYLPHLAVEPAACPSLTQGTYAYDFGDTAGMTPLMKMHTLGHDFVPDPIHAGGLRYHGMSPLISHLYETGEIEAVAKPQTECFSAGVLFARTEGIVPAPEPTHALAAAVEEALRCKESGEEKVILTALCGHGHLDLPAYDAYLSGQVVDHAWEDADIQAAVADALSRLPVLA